MAAFGRLLAVSLALGASAAAKPAGSAAAAPSPAQWWRPTKGMAFQYQLSEPMDPDKHFIPGVQVYFVDGYDTSADVVAALKAKGNASWPVFPVCYISAGTFEDWRPDAGEFADGDKGAPLENWPGETYLDIRSDGVRKVMRRRLEMCRDKGFVAVDPDNVGAFSNPNGLGLTAQDQIDYNTWLAATAHELGLAVGLKNDLEQLPELAPLFDFFVNEQCHVYDECRSYAPAIKAGKPVWNVEYEPSAFKVACRNETTSGITSIYKKIKLDACRHDCSSSSLDCPADQPKASAAGGGGGGGGWWLHLLCAAAAWQVARGLAA